ncbi:hypothetical protein KUTeg_005047 [Tegillarca granosa]|uniref:Uncharacterized protein n=1 Tax=Tegillarca granosa TaxID=220873 RepID=A0ABQ9FN70_TEGGR|nr:hypothetical protein KUTeg_005047 [Tegillarca granosa]
MRLNKFQTNYHSTLHQCQQKLKRKGNIFMINKNNSKNMAKEILLCDNTELRSLYDVVTETIDPFTGAGNKFIGTFFRTTTFQKFVKKVIRNPDLTPATHNVAYRFKDQAGKGHDDDGKLVLEDK